MTQPEKDRGTGGEGSIVSPWAEYKMKVAYSSDAYSAVAFRRYSLGATLNTRLNALLKAASES
jgi:hypothetical protein